MSEDIFAPLDDIKMDDAVEEVYREMEKYRKEIESYLWKRLYMGYEIIENGGIIFITNNKVKTRKEQLKWLKKYSDELRTYGIEAEVYDEGDEPYICI